MYYGFGQNRAPARPDDAVYGQYRVESLVYISKRGDQADQVTVHVNAVDATTIKVPAAAIMLQNQ
jgi:hypothetical protein